MHQSKRCNQKGHCLSLPGVWWGQKPCSNNPGSDKKPPPFQRTQQAIVSLWGQKPCSNIPGSDKDHRPFIKPSRLWSLCLGCGGGSSVWRQKQCVEAEACGQQYSRCRPGSSRGRRGQSPGGVRGSPGDTPASTSHTATAVPPCHTPHTTLACPATTTVASL